MRRENKNNTVPNLHERCDWARSSTVEQGSFKPTVEGSNPSALTDGHWSDCATHNEPAMPNGPCDCGGYPPPTQSGQTR